MSKHTPVMTICLSIAVAFAASESLCAQQSPPIDLGASASALRFRYIGPDGNRVAAVAGVAGDPNVYYVGAASGGIWKTIDGGINWAPIFDTSRSPPSARSPWRRRIRTSSGPAPASRDPQPHLGRPGHLQVDGRRQERGRSWASTQTGRIARIVIHPKNPDIVLVVRARSRATARSRSAASSARPTAARRGRKVLFVDENTGCSDLAMDPNNPRILFAGMWQLEIHTWGRDSGGPGSGLSTSRDGGVTGRSSRATACPTQPVGKVGRRDLARRNPKRVYALIETGRRRALDGPGHRARPAVALRQTAATRGRS